MAIKKIEKNEKVKLLFDNTDNYLKKNYNIALRKNIIKTFLGIKKNCSILDIGCGNGELSIDYTNNNKVDFLDISENMLNIVKKKLNIEQYNNCQFILGDFLEHKFDKKYDVIIFVGVLAHISSVDDALKKITTLLKKNGHVIYQFTDESNFIGRLSLLHIHYKNKIFNREHTRHRLNVIKLNSFLEKLDKKNMVVEEEKSYSSLLPGMGKLGSKIQRSYQQNTLKNYISKLGSEIFLKVKYKI